MTKPLLLSIQTAPLVDICSTEEAYLTRRFQLLKDCGFDAVDLNIDSFVRGDLKKGEFDRFWDKSLTELYKHFTVLKNAAHRSGVLFSQMHAVFPLYIPDQAEATEYVRMSVEKTLAVAAFLACPAVVVHPYSCRDKEAERSINLALFRRLMPFAKQYGVTVCLENLTMVENGMRMDGACSTAEEACWYIDTLNKEAGGNVFGFCFDIGHATLLRRDIRTFIRTLGHRLTCLHLHDNDGMADLHVIPFTQQHMIGRQTTACATDWDGLQAGLREIGYIGTLSFETFKSFLVFPDATHPELLRLCAGLGHHFRNQILKEK